MATPRSSTRTRPDDRLEEARVPPTEEGREVYSVALQRLPLFSQRENPTLWFMRAEAAMLAAKVTSDTRDREIPGPEREVAGTLQPVGGIERPPSA